MELMEPEGILISLMLMEDFARLRSQPELKRLVRHSTVFRLLKSCRLSLLTLFLFIGSFVVTKGRPREPLAYIHSKPVKYTNNGGGRDTYISDSAGGLNLIY